jgi:hypothetical protein
VTTRQGDLALLNDPVAQELLQSTNLAKLAYTWTDGTPRVVPIWFHWDGRQIVMGTPTIAPKTKALAAHPRVAITIDTHDFPWKVLLVRGAVSVQVMDRIVPEYALATHRYFGPGADGWLQQVEATLAASKGMARIAVTPEWVAILDFEQRFPSALEKAMASAPAAT